ncbi:hypothetical protein FT663_05152 [Candidozyma haemuli var. vulneris]|uniref:F-box domain-containing protein n=1 Tax=Candidozyma haemuli TaxID=45357 RepID=A0A2V1AVP9_9ASCO|nr:hypothetical protein CXQ85_000578 [[Candida] haemuloni]KAF3985806.1 hypothetical protein FT663_05152 [[Candida] haemuloni var. vulneris]KAF3994260.1 hypothetical protein FT662_00129 [[Candida] haemuloni var. vulneris]PVH21596.1 hypothetical protein CXQ85_000578 [[Candida] haemuloni]
MEIRDLPLNIISLIFEYIPSEEIDRVLTAVGPRPHDILYRAADTVKHSKLLVTNEWQSSLKLLPRAVQILPIRLLEYFWHISLSDFRNLAFELEKKWDGRIPVKRNISLVFRFDLSNSSARYKTFRDLQYLLKTMPIPVQRATKLLYLSVPDTQGFLLGEGIDQLTGLVLQRLVHSPAFHKSLESLRFQSATPSFSLLASSNITLRKLSHFDQLSSLDLCNLGLRDLREICLPASLVHLNLSQNSLQTIKQDRLPPKLFSLDLSFNLLTEVDGSCLPANLKKLNIRRNMVEHLEDLPTTLEYLDISFNELTSAPFAIPPNLCYLRTDIAQFYLMSESTRHDLLNQKVIIQKHDNRGFD